MGVKSARRRGRRRAQSQRAPARRDEVDAQAERRFGRLAKGGGSAAARAAEERLVAEADAQDQCRDNLVIERHSDYALSAGRTSDRAASKGQGDDGRGSPVKVSSLHIDRERPGLSGGTRD